MAATSCFSLSMLRYYSLNFLWLDVLLLFFSDLMSTLSLAVASHPATLSMLKETCPVFHGGLRHVIE